MTSLLCTMQRKYLAWIQSSLEILVLIDFWYNTDTHIRWQLGKQTHFGVALFKTNLYFAHGAGNIVSVFKNSFSMTGTPIQLFYLKNLFGMPPQALDIYALDDSGINARPLPDSLVEPHDRADHWTHVSLVRIISGKGLSGFYTW